MKEWIKPEVTKLDVGLTQVPGNGNHTGRDDHPKGNATGWGPSVPVVGS